MPGKKKSGKKSSKKSVPPPPPEAKADSPVQNETTLDQPMNLVPTPIPGEKLLSVLQQNEANEKTFLGMKLPNAIFDQLTMQEIRDLRQVFEAFDVDHSNSIDVKELYRAMKILGFKISRAEVRQIMADVDTKGKGEISFVDFLMFIIDRQKDSRDIYEEIRQGFKLFDIEEHGKISAGMLRKVCREAGVKLSEAEARDMIEIADTNGDGAVDEDEFIAIMLKTNLF